MKKLLSILGTVSLITSGSGNLIAYETPDDLPIFEIPKIPAPEIPV